MEAAQLVISTSGLDQDKKREVVSHASDLGIVIEPNLTYACTHLVSDTVLSDKYLVAVQVRRRRVPRLLAQHLSSASSTRAVWVPLAERPRRRTGGRPPPARARAGA